jgi:aminoglycoside phosphotransferase (APT) family kinase protein
VRWRDHLDSLAALEAGWADAVSGRSLVHLDIRADNVLLGAGGAVHVVDWPWAAVAAPWVDVVAFLPSVAMQGGPDPEGLWQRHPLRRGVDDEAADAFLAALAGMFTYHSLLPDPPGLPTVRAFQAGQARTACAWLAARRRW